VAFAQHDFWLRFPVLEMSMALKKHPHLISVKDFLKKFLMHDPKLYITNVNVTVDGKKLDLIETSMTEFDSTVSYFRFCRYLGADSFFSTGISLADYRKSYAMFIYSLATTHNEVFGMINGTKTGTVRMEVEFSSETLYPLYMIVFSEMSSTLSIDSKREVKLSYVPPLKEL
jgi:hypothetical protein